MQGGVPIGEKGPQPKPIATFEAHIPAIKSAILFGSDGATVKLEIPGTDIDAALALARDGQHKMLQVVVFAAPT